ncbi:hypothetical protein Tco_0766588, partial [Tanacetum coccineum]
MSAATPPPPAATTGPAVAVV